MIEVERVSKHFQGLEALKEVSLSVQPGSIYGLVGSNGAGKTTLLKLLAGIYRPDAGSLTIDSQPIYENEAIKARTVFIPDSLYYYPAYSIKDMAGFYARIYPDWNQERFEKLGDYFKLAVKQRISTLSKGMQRQAAFWLALSLMPDVMILDEPLDGLDPVMRQKVKNLIIHEVAERAASVIISSHNLRELEDLCDKIGILHQGEMLLQKDLDDLKADIHKIQVAFSGAIPSAFLQGIEVAHYEQRSTSLLLIARGSYEQIITHMQAFKPAILDILPLTLEEIFIHEMGDNGYEIHHIYF